MSSSIERDSDPLLVVCVFADVAEDGAVSRWSGPASYSSLRDALDAGPPLASLADRVASARDLESTLLADLGMGEAPAAFYDAPFGIVVAPELSAELARRDAQVDADALSALVQAQR